MNEQDFQMLSTLNETHNITKTANQLYVSQSTISKRIFSLEQELGITLLVRTQRGIQFTPEGEKVLSYALQAADSLKTMREELAAEKGIISGTLNLGVTNNYALFCLTDMIAPFLRAYPEVTTNVITDHSRHIHSRLESGNLDVGIVRGEHHWQDQAVLLNSENICAIRCQKDKGRSLHEIPYIGRLTDPALDRKISRWLHENQFDTSHIKINVENIITCVSMVDHGLGWAIVPEIALAHFTGIAEPLVYADGTPLTHHTYLMYAEKNRALPQVDAFIRTILETSAASRTANSENAE